jgi:hypothetical protein
MANIDSTSGLLYEVKRPVENKVYTVDFREIIKYGRTISSIDSVASQATGNVVEVSPLAIGATSISDRSVSAKLSSGTDGENYEVTVTVTDSEGCVHSDDVMIKVRKAGNV